jgi:hypothetical protein
VSAAEGPPGESAEVTRMIGTLEAELAGAGEELRVLAAGVARLFARRWWDRRWARFLAGIVLWGGATTVGFALSYGVAALTWLWRGY